MKSTCTIRRGQAAYTMVELMVAMLISVILMVAMYQIFARVQKVFTEGNHRGKMYEEGRAVMDLIVRDLEQIAPSGLPALSWPGSPPQRRRPENWPGSNPDGSLYRAPANKWNDGNLYDYGYNFMAKECHFYSVIQKGNSLTYVTKILNEIEKLNEEQRIDTLDLEPFNNLGVYQLSTTELFKCKKEITVLEVEYSKLPIPTHPGWRAAISETLISSRVEFFTNEDGDVFESEKWRVMGYRLYSQNNPVIRNTEIIGALWRFESNPGPKEGLLDTALDLREYGDLNYRKLSDNVIHFRMRAVSRDVQFARMLLENPNFDGYDVPLYVEVELGIIEERLKKEILNDAEVERYDMRIEDDPTNTNLQIGRNVRIMKMLAKNTDRILMLRQIVPITSPN
jgi:prepilin-type N-terminal cleavage/methylation domain-containing protein